MEDSLGTEIGFVPQFRDYDRATGGIVKAIYQCVVEPLQWGGLNASVPGDLGDELYDCQDEISICGHLKHPGDTIGIPDVTIPVSVLIEEWGWLVELVGHRDLLMVTSATCIGRR